MRSPGTNTGCYQAANCLYWCHSPDCWLIDIHKAVITIKDMTRDQASSCGVQPCGCPISWMFLWEIMREWGSCASSSWFFGFCVSPVKSDFYIQTAFHCNICQYISCPYWTKQVKILALGVYIPLGKRKTKNKWIRKCSIRLCKVCKSICVCEKYVLDEVKCCEEKLSKQWRMLGRHTYF